MQYHFIKIISKIINKYNSNKMFTLRTLKELSSPISSISQGIKSEISPRRPVKNVAKNLCFLTPTKSDTKSSFKNKSLNCPNIKINLVKCGEDDPYNVRGTKSPLLLLNTPNKIDILKAGLLNKDFTILGKGTFGTVVKGFYKDENVAIKVIENKSNLGDKNILNLKHANLIKVSDIITTNESYAIIIMECLNNYVDLQKILDNTSICIDWHKVIRIALEISLALEYCHKNGILHLDVKPSNILIHREFGAFSKLCDFGNSIKIDDIAQLTTPFIHEGTVIYTDPEVLKGELPTIASDVYSYGILLWQLRYRVRPYESLENKDVVIYKVVKFGIRPSDQLQSEIKDVYCELYKACWSFKKGDRPKLSEIITKLEQLKNS